LKNGNGCPARITMTIFYIYFLEYKTDVRNMLQNKRNSVNIVKDTNGVEKMTNIEIIDIKDEFYKNTKPGEGQILLEKLQGNQLYSPMSKHEVNIANFLVKEFGGDVTRRNVSRLENTTTSDYFWNKNGNMEAWELKGYIGQPHNIAKKISIALKQAENVIIDLTNNKYDINKIVEEAKRKISTHNN
jgi:hypothetical protein